MLHFPLREMCKVLAFGSAATAGPETPLLAGDGVYSMHMMISLGE
jgi:hypothetical protein